MDVASYEADKKVEVIGERRWCRQWPGWVAWWKSLRSDCRSGL